MPARANTLEFTPAAARALKKLAAPIQRRIVDAIETLALAPRPSGVEKLAGDDNAWRIRIGDYRVIYEIHDRRLLIVILTVGHRREVYKQK